MSAAADMSDWALAETMRRDPICKLNLEGIGFKDKDIAEMLEWVTYGGFLSADKNYHLRALYVPERKRQLERRMPVYCVGVDGEIANQDDDFKAAIGILSMIIVPRVCNG